MELRISKPPFSGPFTPQLPITDNFTLLATEQPRPLEDCVPDSLDEERCADPSTVGRWFQRRRAGLCLYLILRFPALPTLFAWDWKAASRMLIPETNSA